MEKSQWKILLNSSYFAWIVFFFCPILSFPLAINGCYRNRKSAYLLFSLLMGLCSLLLYPPRADSYRHYLDFVEVAELSWEELLFYLSFNIKVDFLLYIFEYLIANINLSFGYIRVSLVIIAYLFYFCLYDFFCQSSVGKVVNRRLLFWLVILIVPIAAISSGLRYGFAATLVSFFICKRYLFRKSSVFDFVVLFVAVFFHFGVVMVIPLLLLRTFNAYIKNKVLFITIFVTLCFISNTFSFIVSILPLEELGSYIQNYTEGKYSDSSYLSGNLFFWMPIVCNYIVQFLILFLFIRKVPCNKDTSLVYNLFLLWAFTSSFFAIAGRVMFFFALYGLLFLIPYMNVNTLKRFCVVYAGNIVLGLIIGWRIHTITYWPYLFSPVPISFAKDYEDKWVQENIDPITADPYIYVQ